MFGPESTATGRSRTRVERRSPVSGSRPLTRLNTGAVAADVAERLAERAARHGDHDEVGLLVRRLVDRRANGDVTVVAASTQQLRERSPPRPAADDDCVHERFLKSIATGTPSSSNRSRSWFSTQ